MEDERSCSPINRDLIDVLGTSTRSGLPSTSHNRCQEFHPRPSTVLAFLRYQSSASFLSHALTVVPSSILKEGYRAMIMCLPSSTLIGGVEEEIADERKADGWTSSCLRSIKPIPIENTRGQHCTNRSISRNALRELFRMVRCSMLETTETSSLNVMRLFDRWREESDLKASRCSNVHLRDVKSLDSRNSVSREGKIEVLESRFEVGKALRDFRRLPDNCRSFNEGR